LCRRAVGPSDYVLSILRRVVDARGLYLAWNGSELVGMTNFNKCLDGSGWLSMARTDPAWRRSGVATYLQKQIAADAKEAGISTLRLLVSSRNIPSKRAIMKGGFNKVSEATHISCHFKTGRKNGTIRPCSRVSEDRLDNFLKSDYLSRMNGYLGYGRCFVKADKHVLKMVIQRKELYTIGDASFILTRPEKVFGKLGTRLSLLSGKVTVSLKRSKRAAKALGAEVMRGYIPYNRYQMERARTLGFRREHWGRRCFVFEKRIH
jgi:GNAT superfamily N-acetyltransferase